MLRLLWLLPRSTSRDFPERNDLGLIRTCEWPGLHQRQHKNRPRCDALVFSAESGLPFAAHIGPFGPEIRACRVGYRRTNPSSVRWPQAILD
jgi:hypothetical protein